MTESQDQQEPSDNTSKPQIECRFHTENVPSYGDMVTSMTTKSPTLGPAEVLPLLGTLSKATMDNLRRAGFDLSRSTGEDLVTPTASASASNPLSICSSSAGGGSSSITPSATSNAVAFSPPPSASETTIDTKASRKQFPLKLYEMLEDADEKQFSHIVSWNPNGTGFMVHHKDNFTAMVVPQYFNLTKYKSFQRQLSLYGFLRVTAGPDKGLRFHKMLKRSHTELVRQMKPVGYIPKGADKRKQKQQLQELQQQQLGGGTTNFTTTTTTTVVKTTTTSTTSVANHPLNNSSASNVISPATVSSAIVDAYTPLRDIPATAATDNMWSPDFSATKFVPVVSTNSLMKQEDQEADGKPHARVLELQNNHVHTSTISMDATHHNPMHLPSNIGAASTGDSAGGSVAFGHMLPSNSRQQAGNNGYQNSNSGGLSQTEPGILHFEGMCYHLMSPTRELAIDVKLKLLEEFNPGSSLLRVASNYVTAGYTIEPIVTITPPPAPAQMSLMPTIDAVHPDRPSLLEPFTDLVGATASAASTASAIAALHTAAAASSQNNETTFCY